MASKSEEQVQRRSTISRLDDASGRLTISSVLSSTTFCALGGIFVVAAYRRSGSSSLNRLSTRTVASHAKLSQKIVRPPDTILTQSVATYQSRIVPLTAMSPLVAKTNGGDEKGSKYSWKTWVKHVGIGLGAITGIATLGYTYHAKDTKIRVDVEAQKQWSDYLNGCVVLTVTGLIGRMAQTRLGYDAMSSLNELILSYTSPLLQFEENRLDNGKQLVLFRGENLREIQQIIYNQKPRIGSFCAFYRELEFVLPRVYHTGVERLVSSNETGGYSEALTSLSVSIDAARGFNGARIVNGQSVIGEHTIMLCVPKRIATTSSHQSQEDRSDEREIVVTGIRSEDVLGYLTLIYSQGDIDRVSFELNPKFNGEWSTIQISSEALAYIEKMSDDCPYKSFLNSLVDPSFDSRTMFDEQILTTIEGMKLIAEQHFKRSSYTSIINRTLYGVFSKKETYTAYKRAGKIDQQEDTRAYFKYSMLHDGESADEIGRFRSSTGQLYRRVSEQLGSNNGGFYQEKHGEIYYIKYRQESQRDAEQIFRCEYLATKIYQAFGLKVPEVSRIRFIKNGIVYCGIKSKHEKNLIGYYAHGAEQTGWADNKAFLREAAVGALVDIWIGNYDVIGFEFNNLYAVRNSSGELIPLRIDTGSSFGFRAQGAREQIFDHTPKDFDQYFETYKSTFGKCYKELRTNPLLLKRSIELLELVSDDQIRRLIYEDNPCVDYQETDELVNLLLERRVNIIKRAKEHLRALEKKQMPEVMDAYGLRAI